MSTEARGLIEPTTMTGTYTADRTPIYMGKTMRVNTMSTERTMERSQYFKTCSISSMRAEATKETRKDTRNQRGLRFCCSEMRIEKRSCPWKIAQPRETKR